MMMGSTVVMTMAEHYSNPRCYFTIRIRMGNVARNEMEGFLLGVFDRVFPQFPQFPQIYGKAR